MSSFFFRQNSFFLDKHIKIATIADLSNDVALLLIIEDFVAFKYIWMVDFHEDLKLAAMQFLKLDQFERLDLHYFEGYCFTFIIMLVPVVSLRPEYTLEKLPAPSRCDGL